MSLTRNPSSEVGRVPAPTLVPPREDLGPHRIAAAASGAAQAGSEGGSAGWAELSPERRDRAKSAYATRRIAQGAMRTLLTGDRAPRPGDLVLARVEKLRQHKRLELAGGRRANLFPGDEVLVCYGNRYAPDQFEAEVPADLSACHLVAAGGVAARMLSRHGAVRSATEIQPLGLVGDERGAPLNLADWALPAVLRSPRRPLTVAVAGTSMNAGKTTTVASMIRGLAKSGLKVGAAKITGTGAGCDRWAMVDAGAEAVMDFTDFGYASTYQVPVAETAAILEAAVAALGREGCDVVVVELADGLLFSETAELIEHARFGQLVSGLVLAAADSMSAGYGAGWLVSRDLPLLALAGKLTSSPLMVRETEAVSDVPVLSLDDLESGKWTRLVGRDGKRSAA